MTFNHRDYEEETYSNKTKSRKEDVNIGNYFDDDDIPPPYSSPQKPAYNNNNPWLAYNNNDSSQRSQQQIPWNQKQQTSPDQSNLQTMLAQVLEALQNQQNNNNQPDYPKRNNNYNQSDHFMRNNGQPDYDSYNQSDHFMRNNNYGKPDHNNYNQYDHFRRNNNYGQSDYNNYNQSDHFIRNNNYGQPDYYNYNQSDHFRRNNNTYGTTRNRINLSGQGVFKVLLLGGTGTGKSTIINTMANYFLGGTLDNPKIVIPSKYYEVTEKGIIEILVIGIDTKSNSNSINLHFCIRIC